MVGGFNNLTNEARFEGLKQSGANLRLNVFALSLAFFRKRDDPLRRPHVELAVSGFTRMLLFLLSLPALVILFGTAGIAFKKVGLF